jgi:hypothetical protein
MKPFSIKPALELSIRRAHVLLMTEKIRALIYNI